MNPRFMKMWLWKAFLVTLVLFVTISTVIFISQTVTWKKQDVYRNSKIASYYNNATNTTFNVTQFIVSYSNLPKNVILRRYPYAKDSVCQNISLSVYEDGTFELIGLVSYPGSGNTWARHLIQLATGVFTGSFYFDMDLFGQGFLGEREVWHSGRTIVQKFHEKYDPRMHLEKAILLIREPFPAFLSFANYLEAGHKGTAYRLPYHHKNWPSFLLQSTYNWLTWAKSWIKSPVQLLVIHYEHLRLQPYENLQKICIFLNHSCPYLSDPCFQRKLEGSFRRLKTLPLRATKDATRLVKYPDEVKALVNDGIEHLNSFLEHYDYEPLPLSLYQYYSPTSKNSSDVMFPLLRK